MSEEQCDEVNFKNCPKFIYHDISEDQVIAIAVKAVEIARNDFYQGVGETIVTKFFWLIGIIATGIVLWLNNKGLINL
jgi:hypothetical protein